MDIDSQKLKDLIRFTFTNLQKLKTELMAE